MYGRYRSNMLKLIPLIPYELNANYTLMTFTMNHIFTPCLKYQSEQDELSDNGSEQQEESDVDGADALKHFYSTVERVDDKEVTLSLDKQTEKLYFSSVLGRGKFDGDGRDKMRDKYYLSPDQYRKFAPPDLLGTKLHILEGLDFSGLSSRLHLSHVKLRDVVKVQLKQFQGLASLQPVFGELEVGSVLGEDGNPVTDYELKPLSSYMADDQEDVLLSTRKRPCRNQICKLYQ